MKNKFYLKLIILLLLIPKITFGIDESTINIHGSELISDIKFKETVLHYLYYELKLDYINIYSYLSNNYLTQLRKFAPKVIKDARITNAIEYKNFMNSSELTYIDFEQITSYKEINKNNYQVGIIYLVNSEGENYKINSYYYFVKENNEWKFDHFKDIEKVHYNRNKVVVKVTANDGLRMRKDSSTDSEVITLIPFNQKVEILEESSKQTEINGKTGKWVKVQWKSNIGWVFDAYLEKIK